MASSALQLSNRGSLADIATTRGSLLTDPIFAVDGMLMVFSFPHERAKKVLIVSIPSLKVTDSMVPFFENVYWPIPFTGIPSMDAGTMTSVSFPV